MKKVLFITTTYTVGGNGDTLIGEAMKAAEAKGAQVTRIDARDKQILPCKGDGICMGTADCIQKDGFTDILKTIEESDSIVAEAPIFFNNLSGLAITMIDRLFPTISPAYKSTGDKKLVGMLTCIHSNPEEMTGLINKMMDNFPPVKERKVSVFTKCEVPAYSSKTEEYLARARALGEWAAE